MAKIEDYVGARFGAFVIDKYLESGKEADVFVCSDRRTNLAYVLRLDSNDPALWSGPPLLPPRNASLERANAANSWTFNHDNSRVGAFRFLRRGAKPLAYAVDLYGVLDQRWLIPVTAPARPADVVDVDRIVADVPTVAGSLVWHELCKAIAAHLEPPAVLDEGSLQSALQELASPVLLESARPFIVFASVDVGLARRAIAALSTEPGDPAVDENLLLRMMVAISRDRLSVNEAKACFQCRHFRANISADEVRQLIAAYTLVGNVVGFQSTSIYGWIADQLTNVPPKDLDAPSGFELAADPPDLDRFDLFLQSPAGERQQPVVAAFEPDGRYQLSVGRVSL